MRSGDDGYQEGRSLYPEGLDTREWLITNGLGSFASGTISDAHTRTYHGWLIAALNPPVDRTLLLSHLDATLSLGDRHLDLSTHVWGSGTIAPLGHIWQQSFTTTPVPTWVWGGEDWQLSRQLLMPGGLVESEEGVQETGSRVLMHYHYEGKSTAVLTLRPLIGDRSFHHQQRYHPDLRFSQVIEPRCLYLQAQDPSGAGTPWQLSWTQGTYHADGYWYWDYAYPEETRRGLGDREDLYSPGFLTITLHPGEDLTLEARVNLSPSPVSPLNQQTFATALDDITRQHDRYGMALLKRAASEVHPRPWLSPLLKAGTQFITHRRSIAGPTVIAGYHWFNDWGRDTLIALPGLSLTTGQFAIAKGLLRTFGHYCQNGLIPNTFPDAAATPSYNSLDATLWWIETLGLYLQASQDWDFLKEQYPVVCRLYKGLSAGTAYNIRVDAIDQLLTWNEPGIALTWMDAVVNGCPITPRQGKPIEINALWYSALCWATAWAEHLQHNAVAAEARKLATQAQRYRHQAEQVRASLQKFWNPTTDYFFDCIAPDDRPDGSIRPNAVIALSLYHCGFEPSISRKALLLARDRLLTPYGLRSLDPFHPSYVGYYLHPEAENGMPSTSRENRDAAYHQGTVWSWLIGPFIRAWRRFFPAEPLPWNSSSLLNHLLHQGCLHSVSEIFDGEPPHRPQGAIAQAWSVAELLRHWQDLG